MGFPDGEAAQEEEEEEEEDALDDLTFALAYSKLHSPR